MFDALQIVVSYLQTKERQVLLLTHRQFDGNFFSFEELVVSHDCRVAQSYLKSITNTETVGFWEFHAALALYLFATSNRFLSWLEDGFKNDGEVLSLPYDTNDIRDMCKRRLSIILEEEDVFFFLKRKGGNIRIYVYFPSYDSPESVSGYYGDTYSSFDNFSSSCLAVSQLSRLDTLQPPTHHDVKLHFVPGFSWPPPHGIDEN